MSEQEAEVTMKAIAEAAQCWCDPETSHIAMDEKLAHAFSHRIQSHLATEEVLRRESHRLRAENEIMLCALNHIDQWITNQTTMWNKNGHATAAKYQEIFDDVQENVCTIIEDALRRVGEVK